MIPYTFALRRRMMVQAGGIASAVASLTPTPGVSYTEGIADLDAATIHAFGEAISNNAEITSDTTAVYVNFGSVNRKIDIANQITIPLNGTNYAFDVIGFNHDPLTDSNAYGVATATGMAGMTLQMHDLYSDTFQMNSTNTNVGGWKSSAMRTTTMATMKGYLPSSWQSIIKPVDKDSSTGEVVSDHCFLLAEIEIFGKVQYSGSGEGYQYAYYKSGNSKIKYYRLGGTYAWWERSRNPKGNTNFCYVGNGATNNGAADTRRAVAFAFCI